MKISGLQKLTLLDYPGNVACIIFTQGCNFRCPFCHNSELLTNSNEDLINEKEVMAYLEKRKGILDGVVISGGEPLLQKDLEAFMQKIKKLGYKIKLDTNGSNPDKLKDLMDKDLIDYIAMDVKNDFINYDKTSGVKSNTDFIKKSIEIIENSNIEYEFRTTVVKQLHNLNQLEKICSFLGPKAKYFIQNFRDCDTVLENGLLGFNKEELKEFQNKLNLVYPNVIVRDL